MSNHTVLTVLHAPPAQPAPPAREKLRIPFLVPPARTVSLRTLLFSSPIRLISNVEMHPDTSAVPQSACGPCLSSSIAPSQGPSENAELNDMVYRPMYSPRLPVGAISAAYAALPGIRIISPKVHTTTAAKIPIGPLASANDPKPMA